MAQKTITFQTNYNNKMNCRCFTHIDDAPAKGIPESVMNDTVFEIRTADNSHPPVKTKMVSLVRLPLWRVSDVLSYPSHGMDSVTFQEKMVIEKGLHADKEMAVYFYQKIEE
ncbi:MAG TPA: hypothetical protein VFS36_06385 [Chitinophagaceae bacterium]|nr:hypothetical protein [Chitinophagaceae bacterium]